MSVNHPLAPGISYHSVRNAMRTAYRLRGYQKNLPELIRYEAVREALLRIDEPAHFATMLVKKVVNNRDYAEPLAKFKDLVPVISREEIVEALDAHDLILCKLGGGFAETEKGKALRVGGMRPIGYADAAEIVRALVKEADRFNLERGPITYLSDIYLVGMHAHVMTTDIRLLVAFERRISETDVGRSLRDYIGKANKRVLSTSKTTCTGFTEEERVQYVDEEPARRLLAISRRIVIEEYAQRWSPEGDVEFQGDGRLIYRFDSPTIRHMSERRSVENERKIAQKFVSQLPGASISA